MPRPQSTPAAKFARASRSLRAKVEELTREAAALAEAAEGDALSAGFTVAVEATAWSALVDRVGKEFARIGRIADEARTRTAEAFTDGLRQKLRAAGHEVYGESALLIVDGSVHVELDVVHATARINGSPQADLSHKGLVAAIESQGAALARETAPADLALGQLLRAYEAVLARTRQSFGSQVMTTELLPLVALQRQSPRFLGDPVSTSFTSYPLSRFRADLLGVMRAERPQVDGATFRWSPGSTTRGAVFMFVPALGRATHVARIWFEREGGAA